MVAFNRLHRKLLDDDSIAPTANSTTIDFCEFDCNPKKNPTGLCLPNCTALCPNWCHSLYYSPPPPPPTPLPPPACSPTYSDYAPSTQSTKPHHSQITLPLKISIFFLIGTFSLFLLYTLYKFYSVWYRSRHGRRPPSPPENQETHDDDDFLDQDALDHPIWYIRTVGLQPSVISAISVVKYKKGEGLVEGTDCSVCLSEFREDEMLRLLPKCNHAFHIPCIDTWLRSHTNCPLCRAPVVNSTVNSLPPEQTVNDSGPTGETHVEVSILEEDSGGEREEDPEGTEFRLRVVEEEEEYDVEAKAEVVVGENSDFLTRRRSVSMDHPAASRISSEITRGNNSNSDHNGDLGIVKTDLITDSDNASKGEDDHNQNQSFLRLMGSSSFRRSMQNGPSFMRRSISWSGKVLPSRSR